MITKLYVYIYSQVSSPFSWLNCGMVAFFSELLSLWWWCLHVPTFPLRPALWRVPELLWCLGRTMALALEYVEYQCDMEYGYNLIAWGYNGYELGNMAITDIPVLPYTYWMTLITTDISSAKGGMARPPYRDGSNVNDQGWAITKQVRDIILHFLHLCR